MEQTSNATAHDVIVGLMSRYSQTRDLVSAAQWALPQLLSEAQAEAGSLFLHRRESSELECVASHGPVDVRGVRVPQGLGLVGGVFSSGKSILVADAQNDPRHHRKVDESTGFLTKSILTVPVVFGSKCFGALQAINRLSPGGESCPFDEDNQAAFEAAAVGLGVALQNLELANDMVRHELIAKDVQIAEETQSHLFPSTTEHDQFAGRVLPARRLSGDFIDVVEHSKLLYIIEGDVAGKGVPASLTVARCLALFRLFARQEMTPSAMARAMNHELYEVAERLESSGGFVTAFISRYDPDSGILLSVNCGHGDALLVDRATGDVERIPANDPPLGVLPSSELRLPEIERSLKTARMCVFSDGISEGSLGNTELGTGGVEQLMLKLRRVAASEAIDRVMHLFESGQITTTDDATLMIIGY